MFDEPLAGRGLRAPHRNRVLVATAEGVFLWPGRPLVYRIGNGFFAAEPRAVNSAMGCFFGAAALDLPLQSILERARDELRNGRIDAVQEALDKLCVPPLSANGARLVRSVASRQGLALPNFAVATRQDGASWEEYEIASFARLYDSVGVRSRELSKVFNPGAVNPRTLWDSDKDPRRPAGEADGGEFAPGGGADSAIIPIAGLPSPWHNNPPERIGDPPEIPKDEPANPAAKFGVIRSVTYWLGNALKFGAKFRRAINALLTIAQTTKWLWPYVHAYLQGPKTLEQLQADAKSPATGYDIPHIVEQSAEKDGVPRSPA